MELFLAPRGAGSDGGGRWNSPPFSRALALQCQINLTSLSLRQNNALACVFAIHLVRSSRGAIVARPWGARKQLAQQSDAHRWLRNRRAQNVWRDGKTGTLRDYIGISSNAHDRHLACTVFGPQQLLTAL